MNLSNRLPRLALVLALGAPVSVARAQTIRPADVGTGTLLLRGDGPQVFVPAPTVSTQVRIHVAGMVGRTRVVQAFHNHTDEWQEGVYAFPLPDRAAVDTLRMFIGERVIEGRIQERAEARKTYEKAKSEGKKASLLEQERPNLFTISVAQIGPGEEVRIEMEYQEDVAYDQGRFEVRFPMVVGPRYIPGQVTLPAPATARAMPVGAFAGTGWAEPTNLVPDADRITPPVLHPDVPRENPVDIEVRIDPGLALASVESRSHRVRVEHRAGSRYVVTPESGPVPAVKDFVLEWRPELGEEPAAALFTESVGEHDYALILLLPPPERPGARLPREIVFVIDTSGSMHGASIEQARAALALALDRLRPEDAFNVVEFDNAATTLFDAPVAARPGAVERAKRFVGGLAANGGTEMMSALRLAFAQKSEPMETGAKRVRQVIFITDGAVGNESQLFGYIQDGLDDRRLFTVGIGSAPNSHFMTKAAQFGRGTFTYIGRPSEVSERMGELFRKLESPILSHLALDFEADGVEHWPRRVPDLYSGEPLVVAARLPRGDSGLTVSGRRGEVPWATAFRLRGGAERSGVGKLWARRKIASLMDTLVEGANRDEVRAEVIGVALEHHLVSRFTSLVAVDVTPTSPTASPMTRPIGTQLPAGWTYEKVFGPLPQGATPAELLAWMGLLAMALGLFLLQRKEEPCGAKRQA